MGRALPSQPSPLHPLSSSLPRTSGNRVPGSATFRHLRSPGSSSHTGPDSPAHDHAPHQEGSQEEPRSAAAPAEDRGLPPVGPGSGKEDGDDRGGAPRQERRALSSALAPAGVSPSPATCTGLLWAPAGISSLPGLLLLGCPGLGCLPSSSCMAVTDLLEETRQGGNFPSKHP